MAGAYSGLEWTYKMEDGICTQSHALVTAARFGLPADILSRAEALALCLDDDGAHGDAAAANSADEMPFDYRRDAEARFSSSTSLQQPSA